MCDVTIKWIITVDLNKVYDYIREKNVLSVNRTKNDKWLVYYTEE